MKKTDTDLQRRDHYEYTEGPGKREPVVVRICKSCGREFKTTDPDEDTCWRCLWKQLSW